MFKHILVPTDFSEKSFRALDIAVKIALHDLSRLTLLHVIETIEDAELGEFQEFYNRLRKRAEKKMEKMTDQYLQQEVEINMEIAYGKRVREIVRFAHDKEIDLIVVSTHRIDLSNTTQGWGSISYKVGILSSCPVMLVK